MEHNKNLLYTFHIAIDIQFHIAKEVKLLPFTI